MAAIRITARAQSKADVAMVFALLKDGATWPYWAMFDSFELERPGQSEPMGWRLFMTRILRDTASQLAAGAENPDVIARLSRDEARS